MAGALIFGRYHHLVDLYQGYSNDLHWGQKWVCHGVTCFTQVYDKRDDFNFEIVNFTFLDGDVPTSPSYGVYISQLIRFSRVCSNVDDFNNRNLFFK